MTAEAGGAMSPDGALAEGDAADVGSAVGAELLGGAALFAMTALVFSVVLKVLF